MITDYHAKYYAHELSIQHANQGVDRLSQSLFDASVDLNPHQIEAALFAITNPLSKGVVLADEVGLGKTIEAGLVLCQYWAERKRNLLIICPAALRRQWMQELQEKFNLPSVILDAKTFKDFQKQGIENPLAQQKVVIMSYHYAAGIEDKLLAEHWHLVAIDEAHKLKNAHQKSNKIGQSLRRSLAGRKKLLLTATPLQNSLMELYGLSTLIDEHIFGDDKAFRKQFMVSGSDDTELKKRLTSFVRRTLRKDVLEYVRYTKRHAITVHFKPEDNEHDFYEAVSAFLKREHSYALPKAQRHLTGLILRKLLASSTYAVLNTLQTIHNRLSQLKNNKQQIDMLETIIENEDINSDYQEELARLQAEDTHPEPVNLEKLDNEITEIEDFIARAKDIVADKKLHALNEALGQGFARLEENGAAPKAIIFTESTRTQEYLYAHLTTDFDESEVVCFSGTNNDPQQTKIYQQWKLDNEGSDKITGSAQVDKRTALIEYFKTTARIMIATEAAAEGVNLQFCSLLINYDLPWNPQRVEQRIGRCHRYGQKHDVVVVNFLNERNEADRRVLELLGEKFRLFDGVFGASDSVLGSIESGIDFEKTIEHIYDTCRTPEEIEQAFNALQQSLEDDINQRMKETEDILHENFDEDIKQVLKLKLDQAEQRLDKVSQWFWQTTCHQLKDLAQIDQANHAFTLNEGPEWQNVNPPVPQGRYELIKNQGQSREISTHSHGYRLSTALGEHVINNAKALNTPTGAVCFDYDAYDGKIAVAENLKGQSGWLNLTLVSIDALQTDQFLIFTGLTQDGTPIDGEVLQKLFYLPGKHLPLAVSTPPDALANNTERHVEATLSTAMEVNKVFFNEEREKLDKWADDKQLALEECLKDTRAKISQIKRDARKSQSLEEQAEHQRELKALEEKKRRQRRAIFDLEDEIIDRRDELIHQLEERMQQKTQIESLFTLKWQVV